MAHQLRCEQFSASSVSSPCDTTVITCHYRRSARCSAQKVAPVCRASHCPREIFVYKIVRPAPKPPTRHNKRLPAFSQCSLIGAAPRWLADFTGGDPPRGTNRRGLESIFQRLEPITGHDESAQSTIILLLAAGTPPADPSRYCSGVTHRPPMPVLGIRVHFLSRRLVQCLPARPPPH
eukprot:8927888-Pyramimonas_sp.AAC.1